MRCGAYLSTEMAAWRASLTRDDMCSSCFSNTKYTCLKCMIPICNKCSTFELDENTERWAAGRCVGYCEPCFREKISGDGGKKEQPDQEKVNCEEQDRLSDSEEDVDEHKEKCGKSSNKKQKKPGRKPRWSQELLNDFIDIIVSTDEYKTKLIFRNIKCQQNGEIYGRIHDEMKKRTAAGEENFYFTIDQLRSKFKKCVSECKKAALTIKSGTGIKRFQEDKSYGEWFQKLYEIVKSRDSCQPEQAIEPTQFYRTQVYTCSTPTEDTSESEASSSNQSKNAFVPIKQPKRKSNRDDPICEAIKLMKTIAEKDPSRDLINFIKDDMEKSREHELKLMQMVLSCGNQQPSWGQSHGSAVGNLGFGSPACSFNDGLSLHHAQPHAFAAEGGMNQGVQNYQFRPISPASSRTTSDNPVYRSL